MSEEKKVDDDVEVTEARRKFLKSAGQVAVATPAVTLLMSAGSRAGKAVVVSPIMDQ